MKYDSIEKLIADIKQEVGKIGNTIAKGVAQVAQIELSDAHREIMNDYYAGYTPVKSYYYYHVTEDGKFYSGVAHGYRRTYNLRYKSIKTKDVEKSGNHSFKASVQIDSQNMSDYVNSTNHTFPAASVFDLVWNKGNRGLPPGYRGHVGLFSINASPVGVPISGTPHEAMVDFVNTWGTIRGSEVADIFAKDI